MVETLRDLGVVVDHPAPNIYEVAVGRRRLAVRAARGGGQDARQLHPARAAAAALRPGDHQQPRRRPDRPPAGQPPRRRDARPGRRDRLPQRLLLRDGARPAARRRGPLPDRDRDGHRERDPRGDAGRRATPSSDRRPRSPRSTTSSRSSRRWAPRSSARTRTRSRSRAGGGCAAPSTGHARPDRGRARSSSPPAVTGGEVIARERRLRHLGRASSRCSGSAGVGGRAAARTRSRSTARAPRAGGFTRGRHRDRRRIPGSPRTSSRRPRVLLTQATGDSNVHETIFEDRLEWTGELRRMGAEDRPRRARSTPSIHGPSQLRGAERRDRRPARRRLADPRRAGGRGHEHHPRRAPRPAGV